MREVLVGYDRPVFGTDGQAYHARACGSEADDLTRRWHGWIEFAPASGGTTIRTPRETTQPDKAKTARWAMRLTPIYLEGALARALRWGLIAVEQWSPSPPTISKPGKASRPQPATGFASVGGMEELKNQIRRILETVHIRREEARRYGIVRNGILLYGPTGCGKTFFARAMAEEFGLNLLRVPLESAINKYVGGAAASIEGIFTEAVSKIPCLLFFDEFDAIARKRRDMTALAEQQMVDALLQQLDEYRETAGLLIVAATNRFDDLDPAVIRDGRFDYKVQVDIPGFDARLAILRALLEGRPHARRLGLTSMAHDLEGFSAAQIRSVVDEAALAAMESDKPIRTEHLRNAYRVHIDANRYTGADIGWDDVIAPADVKRKLQFIGQFIENPELIRELGISPPSGVLLSGPPGAGKTTIARVLASQSHASFFAVNAADIFSKWVGESEQHVRDLFARARSRVPAIIFIDEIDAITERRAEGDSAGDAVRNGVVNMFLSEMDGLDSSTRVIVIGATNRPELLDEAILRPGRLGERIEIPLPDLDARKAMLELFTQKMHLANSVNLELLAHQTEGASGAMLKGLCTLAGRHALVRTLDSAPSSQKRVAPAITQDDFEHALGELYGPPRRRMIGFSPPEASRTA